MTNDERRLSRGSPSTRARSAGNQHAKKSKADSKNKDSDRIFVLRRGSGRSIYRSL